MTDIGTYVGLDIGKTKIACGLVNDEGKVLSRIQERTQLEGGAERIIHQSMSLVSKMIHSTDSKPLGIGIGSTGIVDPQNGKIVKSGSVPGWKDIPIRNIFADSFHLPVMVENDVNAAGLGEFFFGAGKGSHTLVYVVISTGVGFCSIRDGVVAYGAHNLAGQIAHLSAFEGKTVNSIISGKGMADAVSEKLGRGVSTKELFDMARQGNSIASGVVKEASDAAGFILSLIQLFIDPDKIVVGGGVVNEQRSFLEMMTVRANMLLSKYTSQLPNGIIVLPSELSNDAGIVGAACLLKSQVL
jgi:glucokinase